MINDLSRQNLSDITVYTKYARYLEDKGRRETWEEIVERNMGMHIRKYPHLEHEIRDAYEYVLDKRVFPSMRGLQYSGKPIEISPNRLYNCSTVAIDNPEAFSETMFLLLGGSGVGYSVQRHHVRQLPEIRIPKKTRRYLIDDSIAGWADAVKVLFKAYMGDRKSRPIFDFSDIRPKGTPLKTSGGKAPGPAPLKECLFKVEQILQTKGEGSQLTPLECHDILCHIADAVLSGGLRRAAMIALFSLKDEEMLTCKSGKWYEENPQRGRANNSAVIIRHKAKKQDFMRLWEIVRASGSGEPGWCFSNDKEALTNPCIPAWAKVLTPKGIRNLYEVQVGDKIWSAEGWTTITNLWSTGKNVVREYTTDYGKLYCTGNHRVVSFGEKVEADKTTFIDLCLPDGIMDTVNIWEAKDFSEEETFDITVDNKSHTFWCNGFNVSNCAEISLYSMQFCNLCTVVTHDIEMQDELNRRVKVAAFIGTLQAGYTDFHYLREGWKAQTEKEALLGVGLSGIATGKVLGLDLTEAANIAVEENKRVAKLIGINSAARLLCNKPDGTVSLVAGCSSGVHAWHSSFYIRRMELLKDEPLAQYLIKYHPELVEEHIGNPKQIKACFPIKAPDTAITRESESALDLLERVKKLHIEWIQPGHITGDNTHNTSCTVTIKKDEWDEVGEWMWKNREHYASLSVLPYSDHTYSQPPFEEITEQRYNELMKHMSKIDLTKVKEFEDTTDRQGELACAGGACEI